MYAARGFVEVFVAVALRGEEGGEDRKEDERFCYGEERLAPCDRFDPVHGALMAIVCPRHTLLAISPGEQPGE